MFKNACMIADGQAALKETAVKKDSDPSRLKPATLNADAFKDMSLLLRALEPGCPLADEVKADPRVAAGLTFIKNAVEPTAALAWHQLKPLLNLPSRDMELFLPTVTSTESVHDLRVLQINAPVDELSFTSEVSISTK